jgi:hypothetical protein
MSVEWNSSSMFLNCSNQWTVVTLVNIGAFVTWQKVDIVTRI